MHENHHGNIEQLLARTWQHRYSRRSMDDTRDLPMNHRAAASSDRDSRTRISHSVARHSDTTAALDMRASAAACLTVCITWSWDWCTYINRQHTHRHTHTHKAQVGVECE